ncbi:MAG: MTH938/NDUFAF3 family protein [Candidatus Aenigmatarchaeota archaeon]
MKIDSTDFGYIIVEGKKYEHDVLVSYRGKVSKVQLQTRHLISKKEFSDFLKEAPEIIVIGNGQYGACEVSEEFLNLAKEKGIEVIIKETPEAISYFNEFLKAGKKVVAYMHVTC